MYVFFMYYAVLPGRVRLINLMINYTYVRRSYHLLSTFQNKLVNTKNVNLKLNMENMYFLMPKFVLICKYS